jgi:hypothetical protein
MGVLHVPVIFLSISTSPETLAITAPRRQGHGALLLHLLLWRRKGVGTLNLRYGIVVRHVRIRVPIP